MTLHNRLPIIFLLLVCACTTVPIAEDSPGVDSKARQVYEQVRRDLDRTGPKIDYDTMISVYESLAGSEIQVPRMDELLFDFMAKRNVDTRLDQMIIILCADIIGRSKYPIPRVSALFDTMLQMDANRVDNWVLIYVADALGRYPIDLPDGDRLADLVELRVQQVAKSYDTSREKFGQHFMPPPKSELIVRHIAAVEDRKSREQERNAYYFLIIRQHTEEEIEAGLQYLLTHTLPETAPECTLPLICLNQHWEEVRKLMLSNSAE